MILSATRGVVSLITVPIILSSYGEDGLAIWLLFLSLIGLLAYFGEGLSSATITAISSVKKGNEYQIETHMLTSTIISFIVAIIYVLVFFLVIAQFNFYAVLNVDQILPKNDFEKIFAILAFSIAIQQIFQVPRYVLIGLDKGYIAYASETVARVLLLVVITVLAQLDVDLRWLIAAFVVLPPLCTAVVGGFFLRHRLAMMFSYWRGSFREFFDFGREAFRLAMAQAANALSSHSDITLISIIAGPQAAVPYGIAQRLFALPLLCLYAVGVAMWPEASRAYASGNIVWVKKIVDRSRMIAAALSAAAAALLAAFYEPITHLWLGGEEANASQGLLIGMAAYLFLAGTNTAQVIMLSAMKESRMLMIATFAMAALNIMLSIYWIEQFGAAGAIWGTVVAVFACLFIPYAWRIDSITRKRVA